MMETPKEFLSVVNERLADRIALEAATVS